MAQVAVVAMVVASLEATGEEQEVTGVKQASRAPSRINTCLLNVAAGRLIITLLGGYGGGGYGGQGGGYNGQGGGYGGQGGGYGGQQGGYGAQGGYPAQGGYGSSLTFPRTIVQND